MIEAIEVGLIKICEKEAKKVRGGFSLFIKFWKFHRIGLKFFAPKFVDACLWLEGPFLIAQTALLWPYPTIST